MEKKFMYVDDIAVELNGEKNVLEVIRKAGIDMPTLCYHPELSIYGACRMCMFENERGGLDAACSAQPRAGMKVPQVSQEYQRAAACKPLPRLQHLRKERKLQTSAACKALRCSHRSFPQHRKDLC